MKVVKVKRRDKEQLQQSLKQHTSVPSSKIVRDRLRSGSDVAADYNKMANNELVNRCHDRAGDNWKVLSYVFSHSFT